MIKSWSISKLKDFERCRHAAWLKHDKRIPEPERELKPGQTEFANDRGTRIHNECEAYVSAQSNYLPIEAEKHFGIQLDFLRVLYAEGIVQMEHEWAHDEDWGIAEWNAGWLRLKLDVFIQLSEDQAVVVDFKSGRKFGNEISHGEQLQLYQLATFLRFPKLEKVTAQLWYIDTGDVTSTTFTRAQGLRFRAGFHKRGEALTSCTEFPTNPNKYSCKWCPYLGTEHCTDGVAQSAFPPKKRF